MTTQVTEIKTKDCKTDPRTWIEWSKGVKCEDEIKTTPSTGNQLVPESTTKLDTTTAATAATSATAPTANTAATAPAAVKVDSAKKGGWFFKGGKRKSKVKKSRNKNRKQRKSRKSRK